MERIKKIEEKINILEKDLTEVKGRETEVYTRIVGYYRAVKNWNKGKREEYNHRVCFSSLEHSNKTAGKEPEAIKENFIAFEDKNRDEISSYSYFYRKTCPNCPAVKKYLEKFYEMPGEFIDVDSAEGISLAKAKDILSVPTVIFLNNNSEEVCRARNVNDLKDLAPSPMVCAV